ncbi:hypothetical protein GQ457_04G021850 [Hibiscus cannabinus]
MKVYLRSLGLWNVVETNEDPPALRVNPTLAQLKAYNEDFLKKDKALTSIHSGLADHIFTSIMDLETPMSVWDKLKEIHEGGDRVKKIKFLTLKREFSMLQMKDDELIKDFSNRLMDVVNQIRLYGKNLPDAKVVEKVMISAPQRFEAKISAIEESCDMTSLTIVDLVSKLEAQEQRVSMRAIQASEGAFLAAHKGVKFNNSLKKAESSNKSKGFFSSSGKFPPCPICKKTNHVENDCRFKEKGKSKFQCTFCGNSGHIEKFCWTKKKEAKKEPQHQANASEENQEEDEHLFMGSVPLDLLSSSHALSWQAVVDPSVGQVVRLLHLLGQAVPAHLLVVDRYSYCPSLDLLSTWKVTRLPFSLDGVKRANMKLELVHSDLCGPMKTSSMNGKAVATVVYLLNSHISANMRSKIDERAWRGIFVGYSSQSKGYRIYNLESKMIVVSRDVIFYEDPYWNWEKNDVQKHDLRSISEELVISKDAENGKTSDWFDVAGMTDVDEVIKTKSLASVYERCNLVFAEPTSFNDAAKVPEWIDAMNSEISAIEKNGTWFLTNLPSGKHAIGVKWVYRTKFNPDGTIFKHKARLVVKGYAQIGGVDYGDTFAHVARLDTIKLLIAIAGQLGWNVFHLDVKYAFLNGELEEDIYVCQPKGFQRCVNEATLYLKKEKNADLLVISLYVDDLLVMGSNDKAVSEFKLSMQKEFEMYDLGLMSYFLGMEINQSKAGIFMSQNKYALDVLKKFKLESCKGVDSPLSSNLKLSKNDGEKLYDPSIFRSIVGSLLYMTATRPDLMFPATLLSRFLSSPTDVHLGVAKRLLRYVKSTLGEGLNYLKMDNVVLTGYSDSDWAGSLDDMKSTSEYVFNLGSGAICWSSKKQQVVAQSSAEAEYIVAAAAANQAIWLRNLLYDLGFKQESATVLLYDNKSAIAIAENPVQHGRTKHINVKFHAIREAEKNSLIKMEFCSSEMQVADLMTKALSRNRMLFLKHELGITNINLKVGMVDRIIWEPSDHGTFSVKELSDLMHSFGLSRDTMGALRVWDVEVPSKIQCSLWFVMLDRLLTLALLRDRGVSLRGISIMCARCGRSIDDSNHILYACSYVVELWNQFVDGGGLAVFCLKCCQILSLKVS